MLLRNVFRSPDMVDIALDLYQQYYLSKWSLSTKLHLYNHAKDAFGSSSTDHQALQAFMPIYKALWFDWKLYRGARADNYLDAPDALQCLRSGCSAWSVETGLMLISLDVSNNREQLQACFDAFADIKRQGSGDYPWVAASKFLHFFNPHLFPIYDIAEMWNVALNNRFKDDYRSFCRQVDAKPGENSSVFNCTYTALAADLMQNAHPELMSQFASWFRGHCVDCVDENGILEDIDTYYATAFEMILLGATKI